MLYGLDSVLADFAFSLGVSAIPFWRDRDSVLVNVASTRAIIQSVLRSVLTYALAATHV